MVTRFLGETSLPQGVCESHVVKQSSLISDQDGWRTVGSETVYKDRNVEVIKQTVFTPTRQNKPAEWTVVHRKAAVVIAPMTPAGKLVLVRQERIPVRRLMWEFPAGQIDEEDSDDERVIVETAKRELQEETGYELAAGVEMIALGYFFTSQGFTDEHNYLFLAKGVVMSKAGASHDEGEGITDCREFSREEFRRMVAENEITNSNTLSLYARLVARGLG